MGIYDDALRSAQQDYQDRFQMASGGTQGGQLGAMFGNLLFGRGVAQDPRVQKAKIFEDIQQRAGQRAGGDYGQYYGHLARELLGAGFHEEAMQASAQFSRFQDQAREQAMDMRRQMQAEEMQQSMGQAIQGSDIPEHFKRFAMFDMPFARTMMERLAPPGQLAQRKADFADRELNLRERELAGREASRRQPGMLSGGDALSRRRAALQEREMGLREREFEARTQMPKPMLAQMRGKLQKAVKQSAITSDEAQDMWIQAHRGSTAGTQAARPAAMRPSAARTDEDILRAYGVSPQGGMVRTLPTRPGGGTGGY
ncbi:MAG: hypothetical protein ACREYE_23550 [Gammaproteobacteria bacterium]